MRLLLARHPLRLDSDHPIIIDELLDLERRGHQEAVSIMVGMLRDPTSAAGNVAISGS